MSAVFQVRDRSEKWIATTADPLVAILVLIWSGKGTTITTPEKVVLYDYDHDAIKVHGWNERAAHAAAARELASRFIAHELEGKISRRE